MELTYGSDDDEVCDPCLPGGEGECKRGSREGWTDGEVVMTSLRLL
eukprot:CAMPEP_0198708304 /NCGR_PEP_ID=MMETSP1471-20131121/1002_1 /TAXON_ID=41880 /ORGANISM="Pycnococcus provasolii, Strain RCC733" /LENGTH=45 /DNA_ID= /DNA_START= /DNA_END= /DNA_ORIENTATION=